MISLHRALCASLILLSTAAAAQTLPDVAALAKTVQKLSQHVDRLQKEVDLLKTAGGIAVAGTAPPSAPLPTVKKAPGQLVPLPGWNVNAIPAEDPGKDAVATFGWDKPDFNFGLHTKYIAGHNPYLYRATGIFHVEQQARYVFQLTLSPVRARRNYLFRVFECDGTLKVGDEVVVTGKADSGGASGQLDANNEIFEPKTFSGGTQLEPTTDPTRGYVLTLEVNCYADDRNRGLLTDNLFDAWQDNRFSILVKGPDDGSARPFAGDELYHFGKLKAGR